MTVIESQSMCTLKTNVKEIMHRKFIYNTTKERESKLFYFVL